MENYELTLLVKEDKDVKDVEELIKKWKGTVKKKEKWGERELAYPIKHQYSAKYYILTISLSPKDVKGFKRELNFNEKLIRYLLLKVEEK